MKCQVISTRWIRLSRRVVTREAALHVSASTFVPTSSNSTCDSTVSHNSIGHSSLLPLTAYIHTPTTTSFTASIGRTSPVFLSAILLYTRMNLEVAILEVSFPGGDPPCSQLWCDIQFASVLHTVSIPCTDLVSLPFTPDQLDDQVLLTLRGRTETVGTGKVTIREAVHELDGKWYTVKAVQPGKLIGKTSVAAVRVTVKVVKKKKSMHRPVSSVPSPTTLKELRIPGRSPGADNPNPSPPRPASAYSSPDRVPLEVEQALNTVNEKVQTFRKIDGEMGKIQQQLVGVINSMGTGESFDGESEGVLSQHISKIGEIYPDTSPDHKGEISPIEDRLGQDLRKTLSFLKSQANPRNSPSLLFTEFDDLRQELKSLTELQQRQEKELEELKARHSDVLQTARDNGIREKEARERLVNEKETMARVVSKLSKELKATEDALKAANHELRLLKMDKTGETADKTIKNQPLKQTITPPTPDFTHLFTVQLAQHKQLTEKYQQLFEECRHHRSQLTISQSKLTEVTHELSLSRLHSEQLSQQLTALTQTSQFLHTENERLTAIGLASAARVNELTELVRDTDVMSNVALIHSEKALAAHIVIAKLMERLREKDEELKKYKNVALPKYNPDPDDQTDVALGAYLRDNLVQVPFIREEPGVYRFGTKRVFIRLEQGNVIIRVGGGYMHLDEFINIYTPMELGKMSPKPEDALKMALTQKLIEQLDDKYTTCIGLNKKDSVSPD